MTTTNKYPRANDAGTDEHLACEIIGEALSRLGDRFRVYHVRPGAHVHDRTIRGLQIANARSTVRPLCGVKPSGRDLNEIAARQLIRDGLALEAPTGELYKYAICPACRSALGEDAHMRQRAGGDAPKNLAHLSDRSGSASDKQRSFLKRLLIEKPSHYSTRCNIDHRKLETISKRAASAAIDELVAAKARGWE